MYISYCHNSVSNVIFASEPDMSYLETALSTLMKYIITFIRRQVSAWERLGGRSNHLLCTSCVFTGHTVLVHFSLTADLDG